MGRPFYLGMDMCRADGTLFGKFVSSGLKSGAITCVEPLALFLNLLR